MGDLALAVNFGSNLLQGLTSSQIEKPDYADEALAARSEADRAAAQAEGEGAVLRAEHGRDDEIGRTRDDLECHYLLALLVVSRGWASVTN